jgi:hypothetical protein
MARSTSNLRSTPTISGVLGEYVPPISINFKQSVKFLLLQHHNKRPDILAYELYGDASYWWVFVLFNRNKIQDPINDFLYGLTINVPTTQYIAGI